MNWEHNFNKVLPYKIRKFVFTECRNYKLWKISYLIGKIIQIIGNNYYTNYTQLHFGSSPYTSSPTAASNIALRISSVGFETVSILNSTTLIWKLIHYVPKSWYSTTHKTHKLSYKNHLVNIYRNNWHIVWFMKSTK